MIMLICVSSVLDEETASREKGFCGAASGTTSLLCSSTSLLQRQGKQNWLPWQLHLSGKPGSMARGSSLGMLRPFPVPSIWLVGAFSKTARDVAGRQVPLFPTCLGWALVLSSFKFRDGISNKDRRGSLTTSWGWSGSSWEHEEIHFQRQSTDPSLGQSLTACGSLGTPGSPRRSLGLPKLYTEGWKCLHCLYSNVIYI